MSSGDGISILGDHGPPLYSVKRCLEGGFEFSPLSSSRELQDALDYAFPDLPDHRARMQAAIEELLASERSTPYQSAVSHISCASMPSPLSASSPALSTTSTFDASDTTKRPKRKPRGRRTGPLSEKQREGAKHIRSHTCEDHKTKKTRVRLSPI